MSQPFVGQLALVGFNFAPAGWKICNGEILAIAEESTLFQLIGTTYGGDGVNTFAIPNLCGRTPVHQGNAMVLGELGGSEMVTILSTQMPAHNHTVLCTVDNGDSNLVTGAVLAGAGSERAFTSGGTPSAALNAASVSSAGGSQPHENRQPFLTCNWIISLYGIFPTQN